MPRASTLPAPAPAPVGLDELWKLQSNESSWICFSKPSRSASPSTPASFSSSSIAMAPSLYRTRASVRDAEHHRGTGASSLRRRRQVRDQAHRNAQFIELEVRPQ